MKQITPFMSAIVLNGKIKTTAMISNVPVTVFKDKAHN